MRIWQESTQYGFSVPYPRALRVGSLPLQSVEEVVTRGPHSRAGDNDSLLLSETRQRNGVCP